MGPRVGGNLSDKPLSECIIFSTLNWRETLGILDNFLSRKILPQATNDGNTEIRDQWARNKNSFLFLNVETWGWDWTIMTAKEAFFFFFTAICLIWAATESSVAKGHHGYVVQLGWAHTKITYSVFPMPSHLLCLYACPSSQQILLRYL